MKVLWTVVTLLFAVGISLSNASSREKLISAAIQEVEKEFSTNKAVKQKAGGATTASDLLSAFKRASKEAIAQGEARVKFEKMIKKAERNILENERQEMRSKASAQEKAEEIAKELMHKPGSILTKKEIINIAQATLCPKSQEEVDCSLIENRKYRTPTGVCNNLENPTLGSHDTPFRRLIGARYEDGFNQARGTMQSEGNSLVQGGPFQSPNPSARMISLSVIQDLPINNDRQSHLLMQWGQFMDHDMDLAPAFHDEPCDGCDITETCVPIRVPLSDPTFGMPNEQSICNPFLRSIPACDGDVVTGKVRPREQLNELTAFIDASQVYGSTQKVFDAVRDKSTGLLRTGPNIPVGGGASLPVDTDDLVECMGDQPCLLAGDVRVNEQTALLIMHTIWVREHNRIVKTLQTNNPGMSPEDLFQTARAIVGAEIQKITFKDYLPVLLGSAMDKISTYSGYKPNVDPSIPNAFATAAFRFGHSQIQPFFTRLDESNNPLDPLNLVDSFFDPSQYTNSGGTDQILRGLLRGAARQVDEFVNDVLTNHLFQTSDSVGMDLAALNIQRGRDHGLPPYLTWKRWAERECGLSSEFKNDLTKVRLLQTYGSLETVDLWVGGLAEDSVPGGALGATFACIFAKTFEAVRDGDRFYYENSDESALFTEAQRQSIEKTSLSRIICDNSDDIRRIQENAFRVDGDLNVDCNNIDQVDLSLWSGEDDTDCYLRVRVDRGMGKIKLRSASRLGSQRKEYENALSNGDTTTCLRFICPEKRRSVRVGVFVDNNRRCMARSSSLLRRRERGRSFRGRISESEVDSSSNEAYRGLAACNAGTGNEIVFNCNGDEVAAVESKDDSGVFASNEELLSELENSLKESASSQTGESKEVTYDTSTMPEDLADYIESDDDDDDDDDDDVATSSEDGAGSWKEKTINTLENLLSTLKQDVKKGAAETNEETDEQLYNSLSKYLKSTN